MNARPDTPTYWFGQFRLDRAARELRRGSVLVTVSPKVFDCLVYLIDHRDRAVGHDELIAAVWGNVNVAEVQLRHLVRKVRYSVDADATDQGSIRTIPRFGYRWVGPLAAEPGAAGGSSPPTAETAVLAHPNAKRRNRWGMAGSLAFSAVILAVLVLLVIKGDGFLRAEKTAVGESRDASNAVAILPIESDDFTDNDAWMRLGLMDLVATHLRSAGVVVVPSPDIVSLEQTDLHGVTLAAKVRQVVGVPNIVEARISRDESGWILRVGLDHRGAATSAIETRSADAVVAAREASDKLLTLLGKHPQADGSIKDPPQVAELRQHVEAAWLAGNIDRAERLLKDAPDAIRQMPEVELLAAKIDLAGGDAAAVDQRLQHMLDRLSPEADPILRAGILNELGAAERQTGKWDLARQRLDESIRLLDDLNQPLLLGRAYAGRAAIGSLQGRYDDAQADFAHARIAFALAGDALQVARTQANQGVLEAMQSRPSQALSLLSDAAQGLEGFGDRSWLVNTLANIISAQLDLLHPADAFATSERMARELPGMDSSAHARVARLQEVPALLNSGHTRDARSLIHALQEIEVVRQDRGLSGTLHAYEAELALDEGRWQEAFDGAEQAVADLADREYEAVRGAAWLTKTRALRALHRDQDAALEVQKFSAWSHERESPQRALRPQLAEAEQAWAEQRFQPAHELYEIALHIAHERGVPADLAVVAVSYGNALLGAGELSRAATVVGQVTPWAQYDFNCALLQTRLYQKLGRVELWRASLDDARSLSLERTIPADVAEHPGVAGPSVATLH
jgi:DNA-binding winged helix-turn-helix (wHTH) protein/tetratricopeptide (TPR) repeat protein